MTTEQREPLYASTAKPWLKYYDQKYIDMPLPKCSAFEYLCHQNKNHLSETALEYYGRKFTFADLFVNVKKTAAAFRALGVKKGDIIVISYIGYDSQEIKFEGQPLSVTMSENKQVLAEVVVTGYGGQQKRATLTTAISKMDNKVLEKGCCQQRG